MTGTILQIGHGEAREFEQLQSSEWQVYLLVTAGAIVAIQRLVYPAHFKSLIVALTNFRLAMQSSRSQEGLAISPIIMSIVSLVAAALGIAQGIASSLETSVPVSELFLLLTAGLAVLVCSQWVLLSGTSWLFKYQSEQQLLNAQFILVVQCFAPVAVLILLAGAVFPGIHTIALLVLALVAGLALLLLFGRGVLIGRSLITKRPVHFFLYFCALYVAPVVVAVTAFASYVLEK